MNKINKIIKRFSLLFVILITSGLLYSYIAYNYLPAEQDSNFLYIYWWEKFKEVKIESKVTDLAQKIIDWARSEVANKTVYKDWYYSWGFPPEKVWVCTDVVRRALKNAWISLKSDIDKDISLNTNKYQRVNWKPDPNIDFRRVPNLKIYFDRKFESLTTELKPWNKENLKKWQPWDIVIFGRPHNHTWIISDKRDKYWVPYLIHNAAPTASEQNILYRWHKTYSKIIWHYRVK